MRRLPELLAPAGSPEALRAALSAGADAVYLGGKRFGARKFAANFNEPMLEKAIDCAHLQGARVYVTVNTLIKDDELSDAAKYILRLYEMGVDALLIQDIGIAILARQLVPDLELHASTQMTIHNVEGAVFAARLGFKRVVLSREVAFDEIEKMREEVKALQLGLEVFVHGAICYCYSGQCLLSSAIGGRSGNRGMCAQPCRKPYVLLRGERDDYGRPVGLMSIPLKERFLISTRDLCVYRHLDKIVHLPVQSLKIEGRMKSSEYVAIVTNIYRRALDSIAKGSWSPSPEDERDLALAFNRDFTGGHILRAKNVMGRVMSDNRGLFIGSVASFDAQKRETTIRLSGPFAPKEGDGLVFIAPGQEMGLIMQGPNLKDGLLRLKIPERVKPGAKVYLTGSTALDEKARGIISSKGKEIPIDIMITWENETPLATGILKNGIIVQAKAGFKMEKAKNRPVTRQQIEAQMRKTGGTPFRIGKVEMDYPDDLFAPIGELNQFRRDLLMAVEEAFLNAHRPKREMVNTTKERLGQMDLAASASPEYRVPTLAIYADSLETVQGAILGGCGRIYLEPNLGGSHEKPSKKIQDFFHKAKDICQDAELIWKWPKITREDFLKEAKPAISEIPVDGIMVENVGAMQSVLESKFNARLYGAAGLNVWNHLTVEKLSQSFQLLTLSPELSKDQLAKMIVMSMRKKTAVKLELVVQGNLEVMVAEDCIPCLAKDKDKSDSFWGLQDFKRIFPLRLDDEQRTHIFNSTETCLLDYMPTIFGIGLDGVSIDARGRTEKYAQEMTQAYLKAIELTKTGGDSLPEKLQAMKERIRPLTIGGLTYGHFIKGLKEELS